MQKFHSLALAAVLLTAAPAVAADELSGKANPGTGAEVKTAPEQIERQPSGLAPVAGAEPMQPFSSQPGEGPRKHAIEQDIRASQQRAGTEPVWTERVKGRVVGIDREHGLVRLDRGDGEKPLVMRFAPQAVAHLQVGDEIMARTTFATSKVPAAPGPGAGDAPVEHRTIEAAVPTDHRLAGEMGEIAVRGTVTDFDRSLGWVEVQTTDGTLRLKLPRSLTEGIAKGDFISVDMAFTKQLEQDPPQG